MRKGRRKACQRDVKTTPRGCSAVVVPRSASCTLPVSSSARSWSFTSGKSSMMRGCTYPRCMSGDKYSYVIREKRFASSSGCHVRRPARGCCFGVGMKSRDSSERPGEGLMVNRASWPCSTSSRACGSATRRACWCISPEPAPQAWEQGILAPPQISQGLREPSEGRFSQRTRCANGPPRRVGGGRGSPLTSEPQDGPVRWSSGARLRLADRLPLSIPTIRAPSSHLKVASFVHRGPHCALAVSRRAGDARRFQQAKIQQMSSPESQTLRNAGEMGEGRRGLRKEEEARAGNQHSIFSPL